MPDKKAAGHGRPAAVRPIRTQGWGRGSESVGIGRVVALLQIVLRGLPRVAARRRGRDAADEAERRTGENESEGKGLEHVKISFGARAVGHPDRRDGPCRNPAKPTVKRFTSG